MMNSDQHGCIGRNADCEGDGRPLAGLICAFLVCVPSATMAFGAAGEPVAPKHAAAGDTESMAWYDIRGFELEGRGWSETKAPYDRLPAKAETMVRKAVWDLSRQSAGICVRFVTDATQLHARWTLTSDRLASPRMTATGASGLDLYVKMEGGQWRWLGVGMPTGRTNTVQLTGGIPPATREFLLYLPLYNGVSSVEIGAPKEAKLRAAAARPANRRKPILFYGTSITQGCSASRPGMCHTAILGRQLDYPVLNLGFSGNGRMEPELAVLLSELDPAVFVLDCLPNMAAPEISERAEPFVRRLRESRPETPILLVEDRTYGNSFLVASRQERNLSSRKAYREAYERLEAGGVKHLYYLEGDRLLGGDGEATVDSSHPTDLGFMRQAKAFQEVLKRILPRAPASAGSIHRVVIEQAREEVPRADTASVVELAPGRLLMAYHRFRASPHAGSDFGPCSIWAQTSQDGGRTWGGSREIIAARDGDINVQAPALCRLPDGELLLLANHAHGKSSTTMELYRSSDEGQTWELGQTLWRKSKGQWLQGGASQLLLLKSGRLICGVHGGDGGQGDQKNDAWCMISDDRGRTWRRSQGTIVLPMRGAMEASLAELSGGELVMSLRTQLGGPFISRSSDQGENWSAPQPSGLVGPESCTCLRRIPGADNLALFWNGSRYQPEHHHYGERTPLSVALSVDGGRRWEKIGDLETDPEAEFTNLDCLFTQAGDAIVTYSVARPAWERRTPAISLHCAVVPLEFFVAPSRSHDPASK